MKWNIHKQNPCRGASLKIGSLWRSLQNSSNVLWLSLRLLAALELLMVLVSNVQVAKLFFYSQLKAIPSIIIGGKWVNSFQKNPQNTKDGGWEGLFKPLRRSAEEELKIANIGWNTIEYQQETGSTGAALWMCLLHDEPKRITRSGVQLCDLRFLAH